MNKRQKKKIMKKYVIKSQYVKTFANVLFSNLRFHDFSVQCVMDARLHQLNVEYQNHLYGHVIYDHIFSNFGSPCTLAEIHRLSPKYDYHMKLKPSKKVIDAEKMRFISMLHAHCTCDLLYPHISFEINDTPKERKDVMRGVNNE